MRQQASPNYESLRTEKTEHSEAVNRSWAERRPADAQQQGEARKPIQYAWALLLGPGVLLLAYFVFATSGHNGSKHW